MNKGITYIRQIEAIDYQFNITTNGEFSIDRKSLDLDEFSQLVALGIDSDKIAPYVNNDARLPKEDIVLSPGELFYLKPHNNDMHSFPATIESISANYGGYGDQMYLEFEGRSYQNGYRF